MEGCAMITMDEALSLLCPAMYATSAMAQSMRAPMAWVPEVTICSATVLPAISVYARKMSTTAALEALRKDGSEPVATAAIGKTSVELTAWWHDPGVKYRKI